MCKLSEIVYDIFYRFFFTGQPTWQPRIGRFVFTWTYDGRVGVQIPIDRPVITTGQAITVKKVLNFQIMLPLNLWIHTCNIYHEGRLFWTKKSVPLVWLGSSGHSYLRPPVQEGWLRRPGPRKRCPHWSWVWSLTRFFSLSSLQSKIIVSKYGFFTNMKARFVRFVLFCLPGSSSLEQSWTCKPVVR